MSKKFTLRGTFDLSFDTKEELDKFVESMPPAVGKTNLRMYEEADYGQVEIGSMEKTSEVEPTILGKPISEVIQVLDGLEIERYTEIKMTMENLNLLWDKLKQEQSDVIQKQIKKVLNNEQ